MDLRNRGLRNKFILKPAESLSVALIKVRGCEALEKSDENWDAKESICLAFTQHSLNPKPIPRLTVPTGEECWYCQRFGRCVQHSGDSQPIRPGSRKDKSMIVSYEALSSVISPELVSMKPLSVRGSINKETVLFSVHTGTSCSLIHAQLAGSLTRHRRAPVKLVRLLAANGTEIRVASSLSARW
ncbi:hypothetical protein EG68_01867 [Paragonimus skrjabini miyazakii]|uniref:Uncharacterized protein n=1 Tax=Paragonimus skrjabini miyazakii TaxID=59628 RepID=A0A8S9Z651_9TREM|nr:hypothetical protein EG68_01867 [Paragonimus skrjabini miyazakii]